MAHSTLCSRFVMSAGGRALRGLLIGGLTTLAGLGVAVALQACGSDDETSGKRVLLHTRIELDPLDGSSFTTAVGWSVTLRQALVSTGPFYYFDGTPPVVSNDGAPRAWRYAARFLGLGLAHAHPGHYKAGHAMGQMLEPWSVDLLADAVELADAEGVSGTYRSARFSFSSPPSGPFADPLEGQIALVEGEATKAGEASRFFRAFAELGDITGSAANGEVAGCEFTKVVVEEDGTVTVAVSPKVWLNLVDFSQLEVGSADAPGEFPADSQPKLAFAQGLAQLSAYTFSYTSP